MAIVLLLSAYAGTDHVELFGRRPVWDAVRRFPLKTGIRMVFNSKELEEAMAVAVMTYLTQKTLF